ncbi:MAG: hypothetical protein H7X93_11585, partial [Sphingomonadaceae bacterium]|nr:hypothetical protein [Sphingomonadaceae bacterium]
MEMRIASFEQQRLGAREVAPDFGALVALVASSQAAQPTARIAGWIESALEARLCGGG